MAKAKALYLFSTRLQEEKIGRNKMDLSPCWLNLQIVIKMVSYCYQPYYPIIKLLGNVNMQSNVPNTN